MDCCKGTLQAKLQRKNTRNVRTADLEDLHPALMYGAFIASLRAVTYSLGVILPTILSWHVLALAAIVAVATGIVWLLFARLVGILVALVLPLAALGLLFTIAEICFAVWVRGLRHKLQPAHPVHQRLPGPGGAVEVYRRTVETVEECAKWQEEGDGLGQTPTEWLQSWFLGSPITQLRKDNLLEFFAWAFWTKAPDELLPTELPEAQWMIQDFQHRFNLEFADGYDTRSRPIRLNFDPMEIWCHPLWYYAGTRALNSASHHTMRLMGFSYTPVQSSERSIAFFHRPRGGGSSCQCGARRLRRLDSFNEGPNLSAKLASSTSPSSASASTLPIVLIHGLGVGIAPYLRFLRRIARYRECFVVELPEISQMCSLKVLTPHEMVDALEAMLHAHGHKEACFVGHSYGTFVLSWVLRERPAIVKQSVFIDPVCFMLSEATVAFNFVYRKPQDLFSTLVACFVRWELFAANVLMRNFYWYHNVMWKEDLSENTVVVMSGRDDITDPIAVRRYLEDDKEQSSKLKVLWFQDFVHGAFLLSKPAQVEILNLL